jgi:hypothetical protein
MFVTVLIFLFFKSILYSRIFCERTIVAVFFHAKHKAGSIENCLII